MDIDKLTQIVESISLPIISEKGFELVGVEFINEEGEWFLRVYIDKEGGITVEDCEAVSRPLSDKLDELDPIEIGYYLEVSSPGINRPIIKDKDFERFEGRKVTIVFFKPRNGKDAIEGILKGLKESKVVINFKGKIIEINRIDIKSINLKEI